MSKFFKQKNNGFTLVETLVAVSIFTVSILGLMSVLTSGISNTHYAKQKIIASYLAQEGIEYIRNIRDTFVLYDAGGSQAGWDKFNTKFSSCFTANGCYFDDQEDQFGNTSFSTFDPSSQPQPMTKILVAGCGSGSCPALLYDTTTGKYGILPNANTINSGFARKITVTPVGSPVNEIKISATVSWAQGSGIYNMTFSEHLFNWVE